jgi:hypothetical protein
VGRTNILHKAAERLYVLHRDLSSLSLGVDDDAPRVVCIVTRIYQCINLPAPTANSPYDVRIWGDR